MGETLGRKRRREAMLCNKASSHVVRIPHASIVRMSTVRSYLSIDIVAICCRQLQIALAPPQSLSFYHVLYSSTACFGRSNSPNAVGRVYDELLLSCGHESVEWSKGYARWWKNHLVDSFQAGIAEITTFGCWTPITNVGIHKSCPWQTCHWRLHIRHSYLSSSIFQGKWSATYPLGYTTYGARLSSVDLRR